ncbi:uncharacterized protein LOC142173743 [Nicotiana tabacum]|uniref:Uncharacterized protein LOC142173743 n=1 Tax=Nicotiana tabacum TaxID=4097 RepID=A0AC58TE26_TOBAC
MPPPSCDCEKSKDFVVHLQYQRLLQFLMGLNECYSQARSQILMKSKVINVNQAYALIVQDESQKLMASSNYVTVETMESTALFTTRNIIPKHKRNWSVECDYCHGKGHTRDCCFKLIGASNQVNTTGNVPTNIAAPMIIQEQYNMLLNMLSKTSTSETSAHLAGKCFLVKDNAVYWIVDRGATNLMTRNERLMLDGSKVGSAENVQMPTGESAKVTKIGNSPLAGGDILKDDLCTGRVKVIGSEDDGLYVLRTHFIRKISAFRNKDDFQLQHCDVCPLSRQIRLPFPFSTSKADEPFHLIHMDLPGAPANLDQENHETQDPYGDVADLVEDIEAVEETQTTELT